jgi:hypothetical protein
MRSQALNFASTRAARTVGTTGMRGALSLSRLAHIEGFAECRIAGSSNVFRLFTHTYIGRNVMRNAINSLMLVAVGLYQVIVIAAMVLGR